MCFRCRGIQCYLRAMCKGMIRRASGGIAIGITAVLLGSVAFGQKQASGNLIKDFEAYLRPFAESGNFTGAVLVARKGQVVFRRAYGMANYELRVANTPETRFHIASVSKPFTAIAILQL